MGAHLMMTGWGAVPPQPCVQHTPALAACRAPTIGDALSCRVALRSDV